MVQVFSLANWTFGIYMCRLCRVFFLFNHLLYNNRISLKFELTPIHQEHYDIGKGCFASCRLIDWFISAGVVLLLRNKTKDLNRPNGIALEA